MVIVRFLAIAIGVTPLLAGCGGKVRLDSDPDSPSLPPLPSPCDAAMSSIVWTACEGVPNLVRTTSIMCAHEVVTKGCEETSSAYWACLATHAAVCVTSDGGVPSSIGASVTAPACDGRRDEMFACLSSCGASYSCSGEGWSSCSCWVSPPATGQACSAYPSKNEALPDCNIACSACD